MPNRYFVRRAFAYLYDLIIISVIFAIATFVLNSVFDFKFVAPSLVVSNQCMEKEVVPPKRIKELLPLSGNEKHLQIICKVTNMGISTFHNVILQRAGTQNGTTIRTNLGYYSDENGKQIDIIPMQPFLVILAPLFFAFLLARKGATFGKQALDLVVFDENIANPKFAVAVKREYLKVLPLVFFSLFELYEISSMLGFDIDVAAQQLAIATEVVKTSSVWPFVLLGIGVVLALFWYEFGSFTRWNGKAYWDRWTNLTVENNDEKRIRIAKL